jgi:hypothetical protein
MATTEPRIFIQQGAKLGESGDSEYLSALSPLLALRPTPERGGNGLRGARTARWADTAVPAAPRSFGLRSFSAAAAATADAEGAWAEMLPPLRNRHGLNHLGSDSTVGRNGGGWRYSAGPQAIHGSVGGGGNAQASQLSIIFISAGARMGRSRRRRMAAQLRSSVALEGA